MLSQRNILAYSIHEMPPSRVCIQLLHLQFPQRWLDINGQVNALNTNRSNKQQVGENQETGKHRVFRIGERCLQQQFSRNTGDLFVIQTVNLTQLCEDHFIFRILNLKSLKS